MVGTFTISIDLEVAWGICDRPLGELERKELAQERKAVRGLLDLFEKHDIKASWAIVGHLLVHKDPRAAGGLPHSKIPRPIVHGEERDWFFQLPEDAEDPNWYGADLVEMVRKANPAQEIGSHSFSHMPYDESTTARPAAESDLAHARAIHDKYGLAFDSFVFPRNVVGFRDLLARYGVKAYRGTTPRWYDAAPYQSVRRLLNFSYFILGLTPPVVKAGKDEYGLINIPGSMLLFSRRGRSVSWFLRQTLPGMARQGLDHAAKTGDIFHLVFHPSNFTTDTEGQLGVLDQILEHCGRLRQLGKLRQMTMEEMAVGAAGDARAA